MTDVRKSGDLSQVKEERSIDLRELEGDEQ
jgi:hypothetical protein